MTSEELKEIIEKHGKWLNDQEGGERANLCCADLTGAELSDVSLYGAILRGAILRDAKLSGANLSGATMHSADLSGADLSYANLRHADLCNANLRNADLSNANLRDADLCRASLLGADLSGANLFGAIMVGADLCGADIPMTCPDHGSFTAWKKARGYIVKLLIPEDARRSSATGCKCRCDKAVVIAIETVSGEPTELYEISSNYDDTFIYKVGETVTAPNFCEDRFKECAEGIHFFINRQEAVDYNL